jgi:hypothetical protein
MSSYFETIRTMLLGFASEPVEINTDPLCRPVIEDRTEDGFRLQFNGNPHDYKVWISPVDFHSNVGYMSLHVTKDNDNNITCLVFRICSTSAGKTYEYKFNPFDDQPAVEMRIGHGANVTGERVRFEKVRCIDFVVFDLIDLMLPPQINAHRPAPGPYYPVSTADKPCFVCETTAVPYNWEVCSDCHDNVS